MGAGLGTVILSVGVVGIPQFARQLRASVLALRELDFVAASRALGASPLRTLTREILPNAAGPVIVVATLGIGSAILTASGYVVARRKAVVSAKIQGRLAELRVEEGSRVRNG